MTPARPALRSVAVIIDHGVTPFEFGIPCEVFGIDRSAQGIPAFGFTICSAEPGPVRTSLGFEITVPDGLAAAASADLVIVPPFGPQRDRARSAVHDVLRRTVDRGARVASMCSAAFTLARSGVLDGRRAATHWFHEDDFRAQFPDIELLTDVLYVEDGPVITSAGTAAGIDMCLHLVRQAHGPEVANGIARRMVVPPHRDGGQAQFVQTPVRPKEDTALTPVLDWARENLADELPISVLAAKAAMSERTFARRFREETGTTAHQWLQGQRVALAETLLERGDLTIEQIAQQCGFGSGAMLRHHFSRRRRTTPNAYRRTFSTA